MTGRLQIKKGFYYIILNYKDESDKYRQKWISTGLPENNNKRRAEQLLHETLSEYEDNREVLLQGMPIHELFREWLAVKKTTVRANSYESYRVTGESQLIPYFEKLNVSVQQLQPAQIQKYYTDKAEQGIKASTIIKHHTILHGALDYAVKTLGIIKANPAERVTLPRKQPRTYTFYTDEQMKKLFLTAQGSPIEMAIRLSATYGFRRSEVLGLQWSAVDFKQKTIVVQHTAILVGAETVYVDMVKGKASNRTMPLTKDIELFLKKLYAHQRQMKKMCGNSYYDNDYICKWDDGRLFDPNFITRKFRQLLEQKNLTPIRFHDLRHSSASLLVNSGFTLKEIQDWLGHADIGSTDIYSHLLYQSKQNMAERVNAALSLGDDGDSTNEDIYV